MSSMFSQLKALEQVEREGIPGLVEVLREEGLDAVRYFLWEATAWHRAYTIPPGGIGPPLSKRGRAGRWR